MIRRRLGLMGATLTLIVTVNACSSESTGTVAHDAGNDDVANNTPTAATFSDGSPFVPPSATSAGLGSIAIDAASAALYVAAGSAVLRGSARDNGGTLAPFVDLSSVGITSVATMRVVTNGDLVVASSDEVVRISSAGSVGTPLKFSLPFASSGFGGPSLAIAPDGLRLFAVEGGSGSAGADGANAVHVARFDLTDDGASEAGASLTAAETFELTSPFEVVPATTSIINAASPVVSADASILYVAHIVLRNVYAVALAAPHAVTVLDTESLQRSCTSSSLDSNGLFVQAAIFDQTVPVFRMKDPQTATFLAEIPVGSAPQAVESFEHRVFVVMGSGFGGGVPASFDGGFPGGGDAGGGFGGPTDSGATSAAVRVFELKETL